MAAGIAVILVFAVLYILAASRSSISGSLLFEALHASVMTFTLVGVNYGSDGVQFLGNVEALLGYVFLALLVASFLRE